MDSICSLERWYQMLWKNSPIFIKQSKIARVGWRLPRTEERRFFPRRVLRDLGIPMKIATLPCMAYIIDISPAVQALIGDTHTL